MPDSPLISTLARSFLAGKPTAQQVADRARRTLGRRWRWLGPLAKRFVKAFEGVPRPRLRDVVAFLLHDKGFLSALSKYGHELSVRQWLTDSHRMQPVVAAKAWNVPAIESVGELAGWLGLTPGELEWFADLKGLGYRKSSPQLRHYNYQLRPKQSGGLRLIESPKPRLKEMQRLILARILKRIPPHPSAHGFVVGRSIRTFASPHTGRRVILRMDLRDFFPAFAAARIRALFRTLGYPESVADLLGGICTNSAPGDVWNKPGFDVDPVQLREARAMYRKPHLPQGAPTSPALANLCTYRLDCRLAGLAEAAGASYTRYADDLAFSGDLRFERLVERFSTHVAAILHEEGFVAHHRKTRIMRQGVRQHVAGLVVNQHINIRRADFDRLKAILTNCVRLGPASQNRESHPDFRAHLEGRVGFAEMINPVKAQRLRVIFKQIRWQ